MKIPLSWIAEYVEIKESPLKLAEDLLLSGTKVESIEKAGEDNLFDFEITPNRADCLSVIGIAREIAAIYNRELKIPATFNETSESAKQKNVTLQLTDRDLCPYYSLGVINITAVGTSPEWLTGRLEKSGIRAINNIVDITNYVMLETGQPMHAFDYEKVVGAMVMRKSKEGETVTTLDDIQRKLPAGAIIIEDDKQLIDLAGLMGGKVSEIDQNTNTIILHAPLYDPLAIRRTSQALGLRTEASNRFEKQLDPAGHRFAFERALELIKTLAQGKLVSDIKSVGYPPPERKLTIPISVISKTLGISVTKQQAAELLGRLEFSTLVQGENLSVGIPTFRTDITNPIDLTEEIGRLVGYNKFPKTLLSGRPASDNLPKEKVEVEIKQIAASAGLSEIYTNTLTSAQVLENLGIRSETCLRVANRLVIDYEYLRPTLMVGLLTAAGLNAVGNNRFSLFEVGKVFSKGATEKELPAQPKKIAALFVGSSFPIAKGVVETIFQKLNIGGISFSLGDRPPYFSQGAATISLVGKAIGTIGEIKEAVLEKFDIAVPSFGFEIDLETLKTNQKVAHYQPIPKFPTVKENISLFLPATTNYTAVLEAIKQGAGKNCYSIELLEDLKIGNRRSLLLGIEYFDPHHTLAKEEISKLREKVFDELKKVGVGIRTDKEI